MIEEMATGVDEADFTALYRREYAKVARYLLRRGAAERVADLAAETFVVAWRQRAQWRALPDNQRLAWLYAVARKTLANAHRSTRRAGELLERVAAAEPGPAADHSAATVDRVALARAFAALPEPDQELIRLVAWEGLSTAEAATVLGCRPGTAAMRLHRARTRLRHLIDNPTRREP